jgi:hypothetical protein
MKARLLLWPALVLASVGGLGALLLEPAPPADVETLAREAVLKRLPAGGAAIFQDVRLYDYGVAGERGVCGQVETPAGSGRHVEFAVRVLLPDANDPRRRAEAQATLDDGSAAPRAVAETRRRYCRDAAPLASAAPSLVADPAPERVLLGTAASTAGSSNAVPAPAEAGGKASARELERLLIRSPANLREQPQAGSPVLRTLPRGLELQLHGRSPGGWLQVGDAVPWGWVHSSLTATP